MSEERVILYADKGAGVICADDLDWFVMLTIVEGEQSTQVDLPPDACRRFGEWLIERANQAGER